MPNAGSKPGHSFSPHSWEWLPVLGSNDSNPRISAKSKQEVAFNDALIQIELQQTCRNHPLVCERLNQRTVQTEVVRPALPARVEERNQGTGGVLKRTEVASFPGIATHAGVGEIIRF